MDRYIGPLDNHSSPEDKIALFRSLFSGRDDVYPRRFESRRTGKSGYQPACGNEWARDVCEKPRVKCAECAHRRFLLVTDEVIRRHLSGQDDDGREFAMGAYLMVAASNQTRDNLWTSSPCEEQLADAAQRKT
jgi:hypothetical protein